MTRWLLGGVALLVACALSACYSAEITSCPDVDCPKDMVCDKHGGCALPEQLSQCEGKPDGLPCSYTSVEHKRVVGACNGGRCLPLECGNSIVSPDEVCDDGNNTSGDGCSADCRSVETCGNRVVDSAKGEQCDDGNDIDGDGCQRTCLLPRCGDGIKDVDLDEQCDAGSGNASSPDAACRPNCQVPRCGDGVTDTLAGEICDDDNNASGDGCSGDCHSTEICGNGIVDVAVGEMCDDSNVVGGDGCSANCKSNETCGNGVVDPGEICDDHNTISGDGCSADCKSQEVCGNGIVDTLNEQCDLGTSNSNAPDSACRTTCKLPFCGDTIIDGLHGEQCDDGMLNADIGDACRTNCQRPRCGDSITDPAAGEVCDDGNTASGDNCSADCRSTEVCGNGIIDTSKGEQCDEAALNSNAPNATCRTNCTSQKCGDSIIDTSFGESCDLGSANSNLANATCRTNCAPQRCGDGILDDTKGEVCDDGNVVSGDGCSADCKSRETCGNGVVDTVKGEQCDEGALNANTPNAPCRTDCKLPRCGDTIVDTGLGEVCDLGIANSDAANATCRTNCLPQRCGDRIVDNTKGEVCDDGNTAAGDGCSPDCRSNETCGNGIIDTITGEQCDAGGANSNNPNAPCRTDCKLPRCGDNVVDTGLGEICDLGASNSNSPNATCRTNCQPQRCGDLIVDNTKGESCDDGNVTSGDGCSADCKSNETCGNGIIDIVTGEQCDAGGLNSDSPNATCRTTCKAQKCGDTIVDTAFGEACDLGASNSNAADGTCRLNCQPRRCGDGIVDVLSGEVCDDANTVSGDGCAADCKSNETCGNGIIDIIKGEECDNGASNSNNPNATCRSDCKRQKCGDGIVDTTFGEACDLGAANSNAPNADCRAYCQPQRCGDNVLDNLKGEICDDNNNVSGDGCSGDCKSNETCGNGVVDAIKNEQCDDGNARGKDGCSACRLETAVVLAPGGAPPGRDSPILVYDGGRQKVVMFGGWTPGPNLGDTWEWDGVSWTQMHPKHSPAPRLAAAAAYDPVRHRIVMFGGYLLNYGAAMQDTWEYDGIDWTQRTPATIPSSRAGAAMAWDANSKQVIMFGGAAAANAGTTNNETWAWDGTNWTLLNPATKPVARAGGRMAFDSVGKNVVLYGGNQGTSANQTCTFNGTNWTCLATSGPATGYGVAGIAFDANIQKVVLWDGSGSTFEWTGSSWTAIGGGVPTTPRNHIMTTYDALHKQIVLFGGSGILSDTVRSNTVYADTWLRNGSTWSQAPAFTAPSARMRAAAGFDPLRGKVVLFGGQSAARRVNGCGPGCMTNDTWEWDGHKWVSIGGSPPAARAGAVFDYDVAAKVLRLYGGDSYDGTTSTVYTDVYSYNGAWTSQSSAGRDAVRVSAMAVDANAAKVVTFGGVLTSTSTVTNDTWTWSAATGWVKAAPATRPPARDDTALAYDPVRKRTVTFSGNPRTVATLSDLWEWDGATWAQITAAGGPSQRRGHRLYYNPDAARVCVYGSASGATSEDLYEWNGLAWTQRTLTNPPATRYQPAVAYDAVNHELVVVSGRDTSAFATVSGTYRVTYQPNGGVEACTWSALDYDNDGKAGCADEECWSTCDPLHAPGTTRPAGAPFCGDGICNGIESCSMCPADCSACPTGACGDFQCNANLGETAATCPNDC